MMRRNCSRTAPTNMTVYAGTHLILQSIPRRARILAVLGCVFTTHETASSIARCRRRSVAMELSVRSVMTRLSVLEFVPETSEQAS
jgi:hypothetical protein